VVDCLFSQTVDTENSWRAPREGGVSQMPAFRPSPRGERRSVAGRVFDFGELDLVPIDLHLAQSRHPESGDRSDQSERLQNPNQNDYEHDYIE